MTTRCTVGELGAQDDNEHHSGKHRPTRIDQPCTVQPGISHAALRSRVVQCRTIPAWLSVKETNTPMM